MPGTDTVAIVTGGASETGREVALRLASCGSAIVVVYLERQRDAEATVADLLAAGATTVAVRADLADELDVERLFRETIEMFGGVDLVLHTAADSAGLLYEHAARHLRPGGAIVSVAAGTAVPEALSAVLDGWRRRPGG